MSRNLEASEVETFSKIHHVEPRCSVCGSSDITVRIYEGYGSPAKAVGGDLANGSLVAAIVICNACGHGDTLNRGRLANGLAVAS
ncbi:MAG: hypothetical protein ACLQE9_03745 [Roseiarcus sp.]